MLTDLACEGAEVAVGRWQHCEIRVWPACAYIVLAGDALDQLTVFVPTDVSTGIMNRKLLYYEDI